MCNGANLRITPRLPKRKNKCVEITPTFIDVIQLCMFSERERASVVCWVVDVLGLCKLVCYVRTPPERRIQTLFLKRKILVKPKLATGVLQCACMKFYTCLKLKTVVFIQQSFYPLFFLWVCLFNMLMFYWTPNWFYVSWEPFWFKGGLWWDHSCICTRRWPTLKRVPFFPPFFLSYGFPA